MMIRADARALPLADDSVDVVVTSPPYLAQRTYGDNGDEVGLDSTLAAYVTTLADIFDEVRRVLRPAGFAWLNIGDKANGSGGAGGDWNRSYRWRRGHGSSSGPGRFMDPAYPKQSFLDVPGAVLRELITRGWRLRLPIVWAKPIPEPASMRHLGRPLWSHEMIYLLAPTPARGRFYPSGLVETGSVWHFKPGGSGDPHLAPFPDELARRCILPTTLPRDVVFDPFAGSGTVPRVADQLGRVGIGVDLYAGRPDLIHKRRPAAPGPERPAEELSA